MTIEEAILHADEKSTSRTCECREEHAQLAVWLRRLVELESNINTPTHRVGGLRDHFAGQALTSMLAPVQDIGQFTYSKASELSYKFADAMLAERDKHDK